MKVRVFSAMSRQCWIVAATLIALCGVTAGTALAQPCGGMQDLGTLGGIEASAYGVSADGNVVVGDATNAAGQRRAFRWTASGGMQDLGTLGGTWAYARGVSADGSVVVGYAQIGRAFRWRASPSDYTGDTIVDILDFLDFMDDFASCNGLPSPCGSLGNPDLNGDTIIDILDFLDFMDSFGTDC
ncbi:MAG: hypothetical protein KF705_11545 [Phycisphaeraceae bacterium]|nr:hypothetical protein [Phycisphaeraceae bacterium]